MYLTKASDVSKNETWLQLQAWDKNIVSALCTTLTVLLRINTDASLVFVVSSEHCGLASFPCGC